MCLLIRNQPRARLVPITGTAARAKGDRLLPPALPVQRPQLPHAGGFLKNYFHPDSNPKCRVLVGTPLPAVFLGPLQVARCCQKWPLKLPVPGIKGSPPGRGHGGESPSDGAAPRHAQLPWSELAVSTCEETCPRLDGTAREL